MGEFMIKELALAASIVLVTAPSANAQVERLSISSVTLSDSDFLAGRDGRPVQILGELRVPKTADEKLPAVILLHGSGGVGGAQGTIAEWSRELNQLRIATFSVDSFSGRKITNTLMDQTQLGRLNMIVDAYKALDVLARHPRIDPNRIIVIGFSRGGQSALYSAMNRFSEKLGPANGARFAAHVAFYPDCTTTYLRDTDVSDRPIRILHGNRDDYNALAPCRTYAERLKDAKDFKLVEYSDAQHAFDTSAFRKPILLKGAPTTRKCQLTEGDNYQIINKQTQKPFTYNDACVERGPTVAYNDAAARQSRAFIRDELRKTFQLK
jgi:dienelactone hydrolase